MKRPPVKISTFSSGTLSGGKTVFFLLILFVFFLAAAPLVRAQGPGANSAAANNGQNGGTEEDLLDFFLEAVEGVEPSGSNAPAVPPLPPASSNAAPSPAALPPVIEPARPPAAQSFAPPAASVSADAPATSSGWTPLPLPESKPGVENKDNSSAANSSATPPSQPVYDPADPFNRPPVPVSADPQPFPEQAGSAVPLGQGRAASSIPSPFWEDMSSDATYPPPESAGNWIQLEVGQSDSVSAAPAPSAGRRPASVYSVPPPPSQTRQDSGQAAGPAPALSADSQASAVDKAMNHALQEPTTSAQVLEPAERENLRKLFSDILPPEAQGRPASAGARAGVALASATAQAAPEIKPNLPAKAAQPAPPVVGASAISKAGGLLSEPQKKATPPQSQSMAVQSEPKSSPSASSAPKALDDIPVKSAEPLVGASEAPKEPLSKPVEPAAKANEVKVAAAAPAAEQTKPLAKALDTAKNKAEPSAPAKAQAKSAAPKAAPAKTAAKSSPTPAAKPAPSKNSFSLIVVNETGRDKVAQQYGSVLKRLGYNVSSEVEGTAGKGSAGQTVISYRPGFKSQAQSVSRYLPGKKTLLEAKTNQVLASEIMIYIR